MTSCAVSLGLRSSQPVIRWLVPAAGGVHLFIQCRMGCNEEKRHQVTSVNMSIVSVTTTRRHPRPGWWGKVKVRTGVFALPCVILVRAFSCAALAQVLLWVCALSTSRFCINVDVVSCVKLLPAVSMKPQMGWSWEGRKFGRFTVFPSCTHLNSFYGDGPRRR